MFSSKNLFSLNHFKFVCMSVCTQVVYSPQIESFSWLLDLFFLETMLKVQAGVPAAVCWLFIIYLNKSTLKVSVGEVDMVAFMNWCRLVRLVAAHCREWNHCLSQRLWVCGECPEKNRHCGVWHFHTSVGDVFQDQVIFFRPSFSSVVGRFSLW